MAKRKSTFEHRNFKKLYNKQFEDLQLTRANHITPQHAFELVVKYFTWAEENSLDAIETASYQGVVMENEINKPRVFTVTGLCLFCNIAHCTWQSWRKDENFRAITEFADSVIFEQRFQLGANGMVNGQFVAKSIGLASESVEIKVTKDDETKTFNNSAFAMREAVKSVLGEL